MSSEVRVTGNRRQVQFYVKAGKSRVPVFTGFEVDLETAKELYRKLGLVLAEVDNNANRGKL